MAELIIWGIIGSMTGLALGILPGVGGTLTMALLLPFTFAMPIDIGLVFLGAAYCATAFGGAVAGILLNAPGTAGSTAVTLDGYPLALRGKARWAITVAATSSFIGGVAGVMALMLISPIIFRFALRFGPPEYFLMALLGISCIALASGKDFIRGLLSGFLGLVISVVGYDGITGTVRFSLGLNYLVDGVSLVIMVIGLFALSEIFIIITERKTQICDIELPEMNDKFYTGIIDTVKRPFSLLRGAVIGVVIGALPGIGAATSNYIAYLFERASSKTPERFGNGAIEGLIAPETADNATVPATLIPTLTLGIPGNAAAAIFAGALIYHGLAPGPMLFEHHMDMMKLVFMGLLISQAYFFFVGVVASSTLAKLTFIRVYYIVPVVVALVFAGAFSVHNTVNDMIAVALVGLLAYFLRRNNFSLVTCIMGVILGKLAESGFNRAMIISRGDYMIFFERPVSQIIIAVLALVIIAPIVYKYFFAQKVKDKLGT